MTGNAGTPWGRRDMGGLAAIALVAMAMHWPFVLQGRIPLNTDWLVHRFAPWQSMGSAPEPHNPELDDPAVLHYPLWVTARRTMRAGHWPLWNPHILCGTPLLADTMCNPLDPVNVLTLPLPDDVAWGLMILIHFIIAGWGMYVYLRGLGLCRAAGVAGAVCYMLNGFFVVWMELKFVVACFCWLFWMLWAIDRAAATLRHRWALLAGLFYAFAVFAGNLHHLLHFTLFAGVYILFRLWCVRRDHGWPRLRQAAATIALGVVFGVCLSAPQWGPTYELTTLCSRGGAKYGSSNYLHPAELLTWVAPKFFGHPVDGVFVGATPFGRSYLTMNSPYVGAVALPFLLMGAFCVGRRESRFFAIVAAGVVAFMLALGFETIHRALAAALPVDALDHHRLLLLPGLCAAALAGFGVDWLKRTVPEQTRPWLCWPLAAAGLMLVVATLVAEATGIIALVHSGSYDPDLLLSSARGNIALHALLCTADRMAWLRSGYVGPGHFSCLVSPELIETTLALGIGSGLALLWLWKRPRWVPGAAILCLSVDLLWFGTLYNPYVPRDMVYPTTPAIDFLRAKASGERILGVESPQASRWKGDVLPPDSGLIYGIDDVRGKEGMFPLRTRRFFETLRRRQDVRFLALVHFSHADSRLFDLLGAKYIASTQPLGTVRLSSPDWRAGAEEPIPHRPKRYTGELHVYENERCLPRAFLCTKAMVFQSDADLLAHLHTRGFDPRAAVVLDEMPQVQANGGEPGKAEIVASEPNRVVVSVDAPSDGYLVLADTNYPGWRATVDGRPAIVQNAYYLLRCVSVPKGKHEVVFEYWPVSFQVGLVLCVAAALVAAAAGLAACVRGSRYGSGAPPA